MDARKTADIAALYEAIVSLESPEECAHFLDDLCTIQEIDALSQRWAVARMLSAGETYQAVLKATGASSTTISRVNRCLQFGAGGYRGMLAKRDADGGR